MNENVKLAVHAYKNTNIYKYTQSHTHMKEKSKKTFWKLLVVLTKIFGLLLYDLFRGQQPRLNHVFLP